MSEDDKNIDIAKDDVTGRSFGTELSFGTQDSLDTSGFSRIVKSPWSFPSSSRPYGWWFDDVVDVIENQCVEDSVAFNDVIHTVEVSCEQLTLHVVSKKLKYLAMMLRDHMDLRFEMCCGANGVHWPKRKKYELEVIYLLQSLTHDRRLRLSTTCSENNPEVPSLVEVYPSVDWHERETFDFFGIVFVGQKFLSRIIMPDDWIGHPQRKDYPLGGIDVEFKGTVIPSPDQRRMYHQ